MSDIPRGEQLTPHWIICSEMSVLLDIIYLVTRTGCKIVGIRAVAGVSRLSPHRTCLAAMSFT